MAAERLVPLSQAETWSEAVAEWHHLGDARDYLVPVETCQLCCEQPLRYHFLITNEVNGNELWVGSSCIHLFEIRVKDESGNVVSPKDAHKKLERDKRKMREAARPLLDALARLAEADSTFDAKAWKRDIGRRRGLTASRRHELLARFEAHGVEVAPSLFKLARTRDRVH
jgi:hypothetical protein